MSDASSIADATRRWKPSGARGFTNIPGTEAVHPYFDPTRLPLMPFPRPAHNTRSSIVCSGASRLGSPASCSCIRSEEQQRGEAGGCEVQVRVRIALLHSDKHRVTLTSSISFYLSLSLVLSFVCVCVYLHSLANTSAYYQVCPVVLR